MQVQILMRVSLFTEFNLKMLSGLILTRQSSNYIQHTLFAHPFSGTTDTP
jgi:hypothetical protein